MEVESIFRGRTASDAFSGFAGMRPCWMMCWHPGVHGTPSPSAVRCCRPWMKAPGFTNRDQSEAEVRACVGR